MNDMAEVKDFVKVPAYQMVDGRVLSRPEALIEMRKKMLFDYFERNDSTAIVVPFMAAHGDDILRILQNSIKALD